MRWHSALVQLCLCVGGRLNMCWCVDVLWMRQVEHVSQDDKSEAVATVVAAVDQARSRGPPESREQVDPQLSELSPTPTASITPPALQTVPSFIFFFHFFFFVYSFFPTSVPFLMLLRLSTFLLPRGWTIFTVTVPTCPWWQAFKTPLLA